jgi:hypothetical protein
MAANQCHHIIRHACTPAERKAAKKALEYARSVGDSQGVMIALARLGKCQNDIGEAAHCARCGRTSAGCKCVGRGGTSGPFHGNARATRVGSLRARGFDKSRHIPGTRRWHVGCSQCQAMTINGIPVHERGCPNERRSRSDDEHGERARPRDKRYAIYITGTWMPILIYSSSLAKARRRAEFYAHTPAYPGAVKRVELVR